MTEALAASWRLAGRPGRVLAAVSGGADSMALLCGLIELSEKEGFSLCAVHVDHGLRPESGGDAAFVAAFCRERGVQCTVRRVSCASASENEARKARYDAFAQTYESENADALALAHHRRDQAETVLLHLFRGSGVEGLSGMDAVAVHVADGRGGMRLWRPLLDVSPMDLRTYLKDRGIPWREDTTNREDAYNRNFLRLRILPQIRERFPGAEEAVCRASKILRQDNDCLDRMADQFLDAYVCLTPPCRFILRQRFTALHPALQARVLRAVFPETLTFAQTQALLAIRTGDKINLPCGWHAEASKERLYFLPRSEKKLPLEPLRVQGCMGDTGDGIRSQAMPQSGFTGDLCLRYREPGDRIRPLGAKGEKSLQDYLIDKKVDRPLRDHLPLLCRGRQVYWVIGVGPGEQMRVEADEPGMMLTYTGRLPGELIPAEK